METVPRQHEIERRSQREFRRWFEMKCDIREARLLHGLLGTLDGNWCAIEALKTGGRERLGHLDQGPTGPAAHVRHLRPGL